MVFLHLVFVSFKGLELTSQTIHYQGIIPTINLQKNIDSKMSLNVSFYGIHGKYAKNYNNLRKDLFMIQTFAQGQLNYKHNSTIYSLGYTNQINYPTLSNQTLEHRLWQQIVFNYTKKTALNYHRFRIEERFINSKLLKSTQYSTRLRYQLGLKYTPVRNTEKGLYANAYLEYCYSTTEFKDIKKSETWGYAGIGYKLNPKNKFELAYINLKLFKQSGILSLNLLHVLWSHALN